MVTLKEIFILQLIHWELGSPRITENRTSFKAGLIGRFEHVFTGDLVIRFGFQISRTLKVKQILYRDLTIRICQVNLKFRFLGTSCGNVITKIKS